MFWCWIDDLLWIIDPEETLQYNEATRDLIDHRRAWHFDFDILQRYRSIEDD